MTPTNATLRIETYPMVPPKPVGVGVFINGKLVAYLAEGELERAYEHLAKLKGHWPSDHMPVYGSKPSEPEV